MVYKFFCLLLPFFKDRTGKPAEPFYFSQDHLSRAAKSCAGVFFYRAEPANPRRKAYLNPIKQAERLAQYRVKGHCPLRVQGGARRSLPQGNLRRQAHPTPNSKSSDLRRTGSRDIVPCGCRAEPANLLPQGNLRRQAKPELKKQVARLAPIAARQSPPTGGNTA